MYTPRKKSCIFGCGFLIQHNVVMHRFPHPVRRPELFNAWMEAVGYKLRGKEEDRMKMYKNKKICDYHFESNQKTTGRRLVWSAVPSINFKRIQPTIADIVDADHSYSVPKRDFTDPKLRSCVTNVPDPSASGSTCTVDSTVIQSPLDDTDVSDEFMEAPALALECGEVSMYGDCDEQPEDNDSDAKYGEYRCNECGEIKDRFRYTCVQCADWDLCAACEARGAHDAHYVLRVPGQKPYNEIQAVLAAIRQQMLSENLFLPEIVASVKEEAEEVKAVLPEDAEHLEADPLDECYVNKYDDDCDTFEKYPVQDDEDGWPPEKRPRTNEDPFPQDDITNCHVDRLAHSELKVIDLNKLKTRHNQTEQHCEQDNGDNLQNPIETQEMSLSEYLALKVKKQQDFNYLHGPKLPLKISNTCTHDKAMESSSKGTETHSKEIGSHGEGSGTHSKSILRRSKGLGTNRTYVRLPPGEHWNQVIGAMLKSQATVQLEDVVRKNKVLKNINMMTDNDT